jgi:serine protease Do
LLFKRWTRACRHSFFPTRYSTLRGGVAALALAVGLGASAIPATVEAQSLPDFTELVEKVGQPSSTSGPTERARASRGGVGPELDEDMLEFFRPVRLADSRTVRTRVAGRSSPHPKANRSSAGSAPGSS